MCLLARPHARRAAQLLCKALSEPPPGRVQQGAAAGLESEGVRPCWRLVGGRARRRRSSPRAAPGPALACSHMQPGGLQLWGMQPRQGERPYARGPHELHAPRPCNRSPAPSRPRRARQKAGGAECPHHTLSARFAPPRAHPACPLPPLHAHRRRHHAPACRRPGVSSAAGRSRALRLCCSRPPGCPPLQRQALQRRAVPRRWCVCVCRP